MTAIEWLITRLPLGVKSSIISDIDEAKEMERQQIIDAYNENENYMCDGTEAEQYYKETYNK